MRKLTLCLVGVLSVAGAGVAFAQPEPPPKPGSQPQAEPPPKPTGVPAEPAPPTTPEPAPVATPTAAGYSAANWPAEWTMRPLQLAAEMLEVRVNLLIGMSKELAGKPISLSPDIHYAVNDKLQLGLVHSGPAFYRPGGSLCFAGEKDFGAGVKIDLCGGNVYNNFALDALYSLMAGANDLAAHASFIFASLDPSFMKLGLGLAGKLHLAPNMALWFDPQILIGLNKRSTNKEDLWIPVAFAYQINPMLAAGVHTGVNGPLDGFGDGAVAPLGLFGLLNVSKMIDVGARFTFDWLLKQPSGVMGAAGPGAADARTLAFVVNIRPL